MDSFRPMRTLINHLNTELGTQGEFKKMQRYILSEQKLVHRNKIDHIEYSKHSKHETISNKQAKWTKD